MPPVGGPAPWAAPAGPVPGVPAWAPPDQGFGGPGVPGAPGLVYAGVIPRAAAYIVDVILVGIVAAILSLMFAAGTTGPGLINARSGVASIVSTALEAGYFVFLWTTAGRATVGMRIFGLQIGRVDGGGRLEPTQAAIRWLAFGSWLTLIGFSPGLAGLAGLLQLLWSIVLLVSTASSPTKQGLHDRIAGSALVRPATAGNGLAITCLGLFIVIPLLFIIGIIALIFMGGQVSSILSDMGSSI